jgi:hypothetical protein
VRIGEPSHAVAVKCSVLARLISAMGHGIEWVFAGPHQTLSETWHVFTQRLCWMLRSYIMVDAMPVPKCTSHRHKFDI